MEVTRRLRPFVHHSSAR